MHILLSFLLLTLPFFFISTTNAIPPPIRTRASPTSVTGFSSSEEEDLIFQDDYTKLIANQADLYFKTVIKPFQLNRDLPLLFLNPDYHLTAQDPEHRSHEYLSTKYSEFRRLLLQDNVEMLAGSLLQDLPFFYSWLHGHELKRGTRHVEPSFELLEIKPSEFPVESIPLPKGYVYSPRQQLSSSSDLDDTDSTRFTPRSSLTDEISTNTANPNPTIPLLFALDYKGNLKYCIQNKTTGCHSSILPLTSGAPILGYGTILLDAIDGSLIDIIGGTASNEYTMTPQHTKLIEEIVFENGFNNLDVEAVCSVLSLVKSPKYKGFSLFGKMGGGGGGGSDSGSYSNSYLSSSAMNTPYGLLSPSSSSLDDSDATSRMSRDLMSRLSKLKIKGSGSTDYDVYTPQSTARSSLSKRDKIPYSVGKLREVKKCLVVE